MGLRATVAAATTGLPAQQSLGVTLAVPCTGARRDIVEVPNVTPQSAPPTNETRELSSWLVPKCCRLRWPMLVQFGEGQGSITGEGVLGSLRRLLALFKLRLRGEPAPSPLPVLLLSSSPILDADKSTG